MTKKIVPEVVSRRAMLRSAVSLGAVALAAPAFAQDAFNDLIGSSRRGNWDDQFDANSSRAAAGVASNTPVLSPESPGFVQQAMMQYQQIVSNGGWPEVPPSQQKLQIGVSDPSIQALRQRLMISGDLPREAGISSAFDSYVDGALKRFQARHGLPADGVIGEYTLKASGSASDQPRSHQHHVGRSRPAPRDGEYSGSVHRSSRE
jgi:murein L,D-transpeptidase YcbB/YkuD